MFARRVSQVMSLLVTIGLLAGCGAPAAPSSSAPAGTPAGSTAATAPAGSASTGATAGTGSGATVPSPADGYAGPLLSTDPIKLRILRFTQGPAQETLFKNWMNEFTTAHPNITFQDEPVPFGDLFQKIQASVAAGDPPDLIFYDGPFTKSYAYHKILLPVDQYMTQAFKDDYVPATLAEQSFMGHIYALPEQQSAVALAYNSDMTKAAGINPPTDLSNGWKWQDALDAWKKLQQDPGGGGSPSVYGLAPSQFGAGGAGFYYREGIFPRSAGDPKAAPDSSLYKTYAALSPDGKTVKGYIDSPEAIQAMQWFQDLTMKWNVTPKVGIPNAFLDKKAATSLETDYLMGNVKATFPKGDFHYSFTPVPYFKTQLTMTGSVTYGVSAKTKYPAEAAAFEIFLTSPTNSKRFWDSTQTLPAQLSLFKTIPVYNQFPYSLFYDELVKIGVPRPSTPGWQEYEAVIDPAIKDISLGAPVEARLHQAADDIDAQLAKYP